ncbi:hypothetical protein AABM17_290 [Neisseria musculi]|uniref:Uncharacterized protein n=1 Tax=Neisseria musculi TaxID=1815583 RepID=A0A7H1MDC6_9NEIS|nr:hypothetical protein H7A79_0290 [Neisseria musculi]
MQNQKGAAGGGGGHAFQTHALGSQTGGSFRVQKHLFAARAYQNHFGKAAAFFGRLKKIFCRQVGGVGWGRAADVSAGQHHSLRIGLPVNFDSARRISRYRILPFGAGFFDQHKRLQSVNKDAEKAVFR